MGLLDRLKLGWQLIAQEKRISELEKIIELLNRELESTKARVDELILATAAVADAQQKTAADVDEIYDSITSAPGAFQEQPDISKDKYLVWGWSAPDDDFLN